MYTGRLKTHNKGSKNKDLVAKKRFFSLQMLFWDLVILGNYSWGLVMVVEAPEKWWNLVRWRFVVETKWLSDLKTGRDLHWQIRKELWCVELLVEQ